MEGSSFFDGRLMNLCISETEEKQGSAKTGNGFVKSICLQTFRTEKKPLPKTNFLA